MSLVERVAAARARMTAAGRRPWRLSLTTPDFAEAGAIGMGSHLASRSKASVFWARRGDVMTPYVLEPRS